MAAVAGLWRRRITPLLMSEERLGLGSIWGCLWVWAIRVAIGPGVRRSRRWHTEGDRDSEEGAYWRVEPTYRWGYKAPSKASINQVRVIPGSLVTGVIPDGQVACPEAHPCGPVLAIS